MKRLALVLAAVSVLGTGCFVSDRAPCAGSVTVDWSGGFLGSDGIARACAGAGVTWVDLFINSDVNTAARVACTSLAASAVDLPAGQNLLTVEGVEAGGRIAYRAERTVNGTCGDQQVPVTPAEGTLVVDYAFSPTNVCYATQPTYIWVKVHDDVANQTAFLDNGTGALNLCTTTGAAPTYLLPAGRYTLLGVNEVSLTAGVVGADCRRPTFTIAGGAATTSVTPTLTDSAQACF
jgi:hypothetical protein